VLNPNYDVSKLDNEGDFPPIPFNFTALNGMAQVANKVPIGKLLILEFHKS